MSRPTEDRAIVDAGLKALAFDSGPPLVCDEPAATYERASDEHGRRGISGAPNRLGLGDKIRLVPGHCDPTVNLYDWYVGVRGNRVEQLWPSPPAARFTDTLATSGSLCSLRSLPRWYSCPRPSAPAGVSSSRTIYSGHQNRSVRVARGHLLAIPGALPAPSAVRIRPGATATFGGS